MGSNSTKEFVHEENERHTDVDKIVEIVQLENGLNKRIVPKVQSVAEVHLENNLDSSLTEIISSIGSGRRSEKKGSVADRGRVISGKPRIKDTEVDDAIAELEETFRTLDKEKNSSCASAPPSSSPSKNSLLLQDGADFKLSPPPRLIVEQSYPPSGDIPRTADSSSSWETLHSPEIKSSRDCKEMGGRTKARPPARSMVQEQQLLPRRPQLLSRASSMSQRSKSQNGRTTAGAYSPAPRIPQRPNHQSSLSRLHQQQQSPQRGSSQILVIQQQNQRLAELLLFDPPTNSPKKSPEWIYQPPKIEGFDIDKIKELNRKDPSPPPISFSLHMPVMAMPRDEYVNKPKTRSRESPDYTKDELELIASLEREIF